MTPAAGRWEIVLPYPRPPLTANQRLHWRAHHRIRAALLADTQWLIRAHAVPALDRCAVELHWAPPDRRRRDADNLVPTLKVCADALPLEGVVPDDTPVFMDKLMPAIEPPERPARLWLVILDRSGVRR
jgi:crossover junction endodeoxyribonuclease RusA